MAKYISLCKWTTAGITKVSESPARLERAKVAIAAHGGKLTGFWLTMGRYDFVVQADFPNDESAAKAMLAIASTGSVTTETMRAFDEDSYRAIVSGV